MKCVNLTILYRINQVQFRIFNKKLIKNESGMAYARFIRKCGLKKIFT